MASYLVFPTSYSKAKNQIYRNLSSTIKVKDKTSVIVSRRARAPVEEMTPAQLNKCLEKFYLFTGKRDGNFSNIRNRIPRMRITRRCSFSFHQFNFRPYVGIIIVRKKVFFFCSLVSQVVWYILRQLFTSVITITFHLYFGE